MKKQRAFLALGLCIAMQASLASVESYYQSIQSDPNALYAFLKTMPKGGELHYHLAGSAYPETMLEVAAQHRYCLSPRSFSVSPTTSHCKGVAVADILQDSTAYTRTMKAWSMMDFKEGSQSNHDHFFETFAKFMPVVLDHRPELLASVLLRAASQNEHYMEIMVLLDNARSSAFAPLHFSLQDMPVAKKTLLANAAFQANIEHTVANARQLTHDAHQQLQCTGKNPSKACSVIFRFQYYLLRQQPLASFFAQALNGFEAASRSHDIVAINAVQPEDNPQVLRDYRSQLAIIAFLHQAYPNVHISLHAGELEPQTVTPEDLRFHIHDAITKGHAERIGHGADIAYEDHAEDTLLTMRERPIPVEINLSSNETILHLRAKYHPLKYYLNHDVPVVLSTDDEGVLRTDLTTQYVKAAFEHKVSYPTLKHINRNALTYSFLSGESLWENANTAKPVSQCEDLMSTRCVQWTSNSNKASAQRRLELELKAFEKQFDY